MTVTLLWILSVALIVAGIAGTVLPMLPGTLFVLAAIIVTPKIGAASMIVLVITGQLCMALALDHFAQARAHDYFDALQRHSTTTGH